MTIETSYADAAPIALVSWDSSGTFAGDYDDLSARIRRGNGVLTVTRGRDTGQALAPSKIPEGSADVINDDALLSPENTASPLFGLNDPGLGHPAILTADATGQDEIEYDAAVDYDVAADYDGPVSFTLLSGILTDLDDNADRFVHTAKLEFQGATAKLHVEISTPLYADILISDCIGIVLDAADWPAGARRIAISDTRLAWFSCNKEDAVEVLHSLVAAEGAPSIWFEAADGSVVFHNRNWRAVQTRSAAIQARIYDTPLDATEAGDLLHAGATLEPARRDVRNKATYIIVERAEQSLQKVWEYNEGSLVLVANETRPITVPLSDPCLSATAPASGTDYTVVAGSLASVPTLSDVYAQSVTITFVAGASGATINGVTSNGPQLRARPVIEIRRETVTNSVDASESITKRGLRPIALDSELRARQEIPRASAIAACDAAVTLYQRPPSIISVLLQNINYIHLLRQMTFEISDRIAVTSTPRGMVQTEAWIEQINHERAPGLWRTTLVCSRATTSGEVGTWGGAVLDATTAVWGLSVWAA